MQASAAEQSPSCALAFSEELDEIALTPWLERRKCILLLLMLSNLAEDVYVKFLGHALNGPALFSAFDHRVDQALAILRPQAIADCRSLLASFGWPPLLSALNPSNLEAKKSAEATNPLSTM
ncbi:RINT-1/TIP-1-like protein [Cynara cardunculus var. scolymus]|uniref:RINT-1/TIP-1-like protein n=1 Tax=Cynara cardunculus var. scolymus TaxID=59895 RepID=A0A124SEB4_CYNCS|nr:RINT-1/TIP-1-like protein [Cynara cardunculus var. scolymus]